MQTTIVAMRADIGSIGGHLQPSTEVVNSVREALEAHRGQLIADFDLHFTGDDITAVCTYQGDPGQTAVQDMIWEAFAQGARVAVEQGLYGAGQDIFDKGISGASKGFGPSLAQITFQERSNEAFLVFSIDKSVPGAFNLPLYQAFADPMHASGLILSPRMRKGFRFEVMDVVYREYDRVITLEAPEDLYNLAALLRDDERFAIRSVHSRTTEEQSVAVSTTRLHYVAGIMLGRDDPVAIVRVQDAFPAAGEVLAPFALCAHVSGFQRGSHHGPLMPVRRNSGVSYFDGPPSVSCAAYCVRDGHLTEAIDPFDHPFWDQVRAHATSKTLDIRQQGFFGTAMQPFETLSYGGIMGILKELDERFVIEKPFSS
ncbi:fructose 1,6-bisphosphatase [Desulfatitalea tepidiphila]|uniref:fructose 1,6-bisphosphatase n=1 Tax=Desulfatitalea tepidiphila TaxID=1185843 RepID=UPI0006B47412|nr:fructose 1,6-bisphosphatase [Desulfatitalea tepidiphila]